MATIERENKHAAKTKGNDKSAAAYARRAQRKKFEVEARRQSGLIAESPEEASVMNWITDVTDNEEVGWITEVQPMTGMLL